MISIPRPSFVVSLACVAVTLVAGCNRVAIDRPIGDSLNSKQLELLQGQWVDKSGNIFDVRLKHDSSMVAGWLQWQEKTETFKPHEIQLMPRRLGEHIYLFLDGDEDSDLYGLVRASLESDNRLSLQSPDASAFRKAVEEGRIEGTITEHGSDRFTVRLDPEGQSLQRMMAGAGSDELFPRNNASVATRVTSQAAQ